MLFAGIGERAFAIRLKKLPLVYLRLLKANEPWLQDEKRKIAVIATQKMKSALLKSAFFSTSFAMFL